MYMYVHMCVCMCVCVCVRVRARVYVYVYVYGVMGWGVYFVPILIWVIQIFPAVFSKLQEKIRRCTIVDSVHLQICVLLL